MRLVHPAIANDHATRAALTADAGRAAALSHPSLAALYDVIEEGESLALAHEHVEGKTLAATLGGTPLNPRLAAAIGIQIADGIAEMHASGITHGAVDAEHIVITPRGQAKLIDPGLIPWVSTGAGRAGSGAGQGAPASDRARRGAGGPAAEEGDDIEALGALLATMTGSSMPKARWADDLRLVIERARPDHPRRYESAPTLAAELRAVAAMLEARAEAAPPMPAPGGGKSIALWALLGLLLLALGAWLLFV